MSKVEKAAVIGGAFAIVAAIVGGLFLIYSAKAGATPSVSTNNVSSNSTLNQAGPVSGSSTGQGTVNQAVQGGVVNSVSQLGKGDIEQKVMDSTAPVVAVSGSPQAIVNIITVGGPASDAEKKEEQELQDDLQNEIEAQLDSYFPDGYEMVTQTKAGRLIIPQDAQRERNFLIFDWNQCSIKRDPTGLTFMTPSLIFMHQFLARNGMHFKYPLTLMSPRNFVLAGTNAFCVEFLNTNDESVTAVFGVHHTQ